VQNQLFDVGADLLGFRSWGPTSACAQTQPMIDELETLCDEHNARLPELKSFVLPGGTEAAARLPRRAKRSRAAPRSPRSKWTSTRSRRVYLNRLSDLLFIFARAANMLARRDEPLWRPGA